ncbi:MAG: hypothetical protein ACLT3H_02745 [Roseburia sp.]
MNKKKKCDEKIRQQQAIVDRAKNEQRNFTEEETRQFDELQREIEQLREQIRQIEGQGEESNEAGIGSVERSIEEERTRAAEIYELCSEFGMGAEDYIKSGKTTDDVRHDIIENMRKERAPLSARGVADTSIIKDEQDKFRAAAADALLLRSGMEIAKPADGARDLRSMSLRDLAIETLTAENVGTGLSRKSSDELFSMLQRAYFSPTSSFPAIMDTAINKAYAEGHKTVNVTFDRFTKKGSLKDFKTSDNKYLAGPAGEFLEVPEGGEIKHDTYSDVKLPTRKLKTYGRQFTMTRQAFINDDIDVITRMPAKYAASARKTINKQVYKIMCSSPVIYDGTTLFSAEHKNLLTKGTGITRESLQKMIMALQTQVDQFGDAIIVNPAALVVPSGYAFDIYAILYSATINTSDNTQATNPLYKYKEMIEVIEDPTINVLCGGFGNVMPWFLIGSKSDTDFIEVDYLNGQETPNIRRMEVPGQLGFVWDIYLDWGISVMDYRGAIKNTGIAVANPL